MTRRIERPADTPAEVYHYWHERWCAILRENAGAFLDAGLAGVSFTERVPDAPAPPPQPGVPPGHRRGGGEVRPRASEVLVEAAPERRMRLKCGVLRFR